MCGEKAQVMREIHYLLALEHSRLPFTMEQVTIGLLNTLLIAAVETNEEVFGTI